MKTIIVTLNAKYIHTSLSVRLLTLAARETHDVSFREYIIKDEPGRIAAELLAEAPDAVAFSCYIWNIRQTGEICRLLREYRPDIILLLGGPEVTYEPEHFLNTLPVDYILQGEGEEIFPALLACLEQGQEPDIPGVSSRSRISPVTAVCPVDTVERLGSPYDLPEDAAHKADRILYFETGRGCPYRCAYCLSSLESGVRLFSLDYLTRQMDIICRSSARTIKLLDRSFCSNTDHALFVLDYIFRHHSPGQQYQIEVNADVMPRKVIDFIRENAPAGLLRLEVGIQSTYEPSNRAVGRIQNFERLRENVALLQNSGRCDLHLDLIAGLPLETRDRFRQSFDEVCALGAKEVQLGFLKLLRGTSLRTCAQEYGYLFDSEPPYELRESSWMTEEDLSAIHIVEDMLEKYGNSGRFPTSLPAMLSDRPSPFDFFLGLGLFYREQGYPETGYQPYHLFECANLFTGGQYRGVLIRDYYATSKKRPKKWWEPTLSSPEKKAVIHRLAASTGLPEDLLFHHAQVEDLGSRYLLAIYIDGDCELRLVEKS